MKAKAKGKDKGHDMATKTGTKVAREKLIEGHL
jgi:hypothetical protein